MPNLSTMRTKRMLAASLIFLLSPAVFAAELTQTCQNYYAEIDRFVEKLASDQKTKGLAAEIMANYHHAKQAHLSMPEAIQNQSCAREAAELKEYQQAMAAEG